MENNDPRQTITDVPASASFPPCIAYVPDTVPTAGFLAMTRRTTVRPTPQTDQDNTINAHTAPLATFSQRALRVIALVLALVLALLAFGVGLPWIIVDAPPETGTLWAREVQSRAPVAMPFARPAAGSRSAAAAATLR